MRSRSSSSSSKKRGRSTTSRLRERANLSFCIVVIFFAVFGIIVLTEIFFIDERPGPAPIGAHRGPDYEEIVLSDDYLQLYKGPDNEAASHLAGRVLAPLAPNSAARPDEANPFAPPLPDAGYVKFSNLTAKDARWQPVRGTRFKFYVYSAFYDKRSGRMIRIIGATRTRSPERVWCRFWYDEEPNTATNATVSPERRSSRPQLVIAKVRVIRENWNLKYSACFVICPLPRSNGTDEAWPVPNSVSILAGRVLLPPANRLIVNKPSNATNKGELAVCVKPLHFFYNQVWSLLEWLEFQSIMGAVHVTMYNHTAGPAVSCVLRDYVSQGLVTLLDWGNLPMLSQREIRTEGLFAALNDCLYRNMYRHAYLAIIDLDEYIVPRRNDSLPALLSWLTRPGTRAAGSFSFQNAFFYLQWPDDEKLLQQQGEPEVELVTQRKTRRRAKLHPHKQRSKYVCKPELVVEAGNHFVWEYVPGRGTLNVPADAGILHHYRVCEFGGDDCVKAASVVDRSAWRFGAQLRERVSRRWQHLRTKCDLPSDQQQQRRP
ncbi:uncharacterized protein LOC135947800 [Cloeon dipterum]|uniref:uncharacterized protein LOC135947800 n=1 Tax=Cloeon dipterum TaxID=197152 RepID=UPI00321FBCFD